MREEEVFHLEEVPRHASAGAVLDRDHIHRGGRGGGRRRRCEAGHVAELYKEKKKYETNARYYL